MTISRAMGSLKVQGRTITSQIKFRADARFLNPPISAATGDMVAQKVPATAPRSFAGVSELCSSHVAIVFPFKVIILLPPMRAKKMSSPKLLAGIQIAKENTPAAAVITERYC